VLALAFCVKHEWELKPWLVQMVRVSWLKWRGVPGSKDAASGPVRAARASYLLARPALQFARPPVTAQVLGRAGIALGCARKAIGILQSIGTGTASTDDQVRLHINARIAEVVSRNTLGLRNEARLAIASGESRGIPPRARDMAAFLP